MTQTIQAILVGNDPLSDGQLFYNPTLDPSHPSGPLFNMLYNGGLQFMLNDKSSSNWNRVPKYPIDSVNQISETFSDQSFHNESVTVTHLPSLSTPHYTVFHEPSNNLLDVSEEDLSESNPDSSLKQDTNPFLTFPWIQSNAKATLLLDDPSWTLPKQGFLLLKDETWFFQPGPSTQPTKHNRPIPLPNFAHTAPDLIRSCKLAQGWVTHSCFIENFNTAQSQTNLLRRMVLLQFTDIPQCFTPPPLRLRKISAKTLQSEVPPKCLKDHSRLSPNDKEIWDATYLEEYLGIHETTHTWEYISEEEYRNTISLKPNLALPYLQWSCLRSNMINMAILIGPNTE